MEFLDWLKEEFGLDYYKDYCYDKLADSEYDKVYDLWEKELEKRGI